MSTDKRALAPTSNMLAEAHAKGWGDDTTPIQKLRPHPNFTTTTFDLNDDKTWQYDPKSGKGAFLRDKAKYPNDKNAVPGGWRGYRLTAEDIARYDRRGNGLGIVCRDDPADGKPVSWFDCDIKHQSGSALALRVVRDEMEALGITQYFIRRRGGIPWLIPVLITDGMADYDQLFTKDLHSLELGGAGHQFVALGPHASGSWRYWSRFDLIGGQWIEAPLPAGEMPARDEVPELTIVQARKVYAAMTAACGAVYASRGDAEVGRNGTPRAAARGRRPLLPADDFNYRAVPAEKKGVFLAVLNAMANTKSRNPWVGDNSVLVGCVRNWPEPDAREVVLGYSGRYDGGSDPEEDERLFNEKWKERGRLPVGWPDFIRWTKADLGFDRMRALGVGIADMMIPDELRPLEVADRPARSNLPTVQISGRLMHEIVAEVAEALAFVDAPVFSHGGGVVHPVTVAGEGSHLKRLDKHGLRHLLGQYVAFEAHSPKRKDWVRADPPMALAEQMLSGPAQALLPQIKGLLEWPSLRPDGSLLDQPGYDVRTGYFLTRQVSNVRVPKHPTRRKAADAIAQFQGLLSEFPITSPEGKSAAIATMLHICVRPLIDVVPMLVVTSPSPRTGKSYLLRTICAVALGRGIVSVGASNDRAENDKRLTGALLAGHAIIHLDNIESRLSSPLLAQAIENPVIALRPMGGSEMKRISNGHTIVANGNNVGVSGDLPARCLLVELDAKQEHPEHRQFKGNPLADVLANQGKYLSDALTIVRWGMQEAGRSPSPAGIKPLASFGQWSKLIRETLVKLGLPDPCATQARLRAASDDLGGADDTLFAIFADVTQNKPHSFAELMTACTSLSMDQRETVLVSLADEKHPRDVSRGFLNRWLQKHKGQVRDGVTLKYIAHSHKGTPAHWHFARGPASAPPLSCGPVSSAASPSVRPVSPAPVGALSPPGVRPMSHDDVV